jgi:Domain of unknown function (DUF5658)
LSLFVYLQVLDFLTTLVGFKVGAEEASPFIRWLTQFGPAVGVGASKLLAISLAGLCIWLNKRSLLHWMNAWYGALIVWNLCIILVAANPTLR